jgi:hypothetical protein
VAGTSGAEAQIQRRHLYAALKRRSSTVFQAFVILDALVILDAFVMFDVFVGLSRRGLSVQARFFTGL